MRSSATKQKSLFQETDVPQHKKSTSGSFVGNMGLPIHRWFRYSAGFSGAWAEDLISREAENRDVRVFDPFAGSGTTLIAAEQCGVESLGIDPHLFVARVAQAKLAYRSSPSEYLQQAKKVLVSARCHPPSLELYAPLIRKCYTDFVGSVRCTAPEGGMFTGVAVELDAGNQIFTTLPVVPVPERMSQE